MFERRDLSAEMAQLRVERRAADGPPIITGYGGVYYRAGEEGTQFRLFPDMIERIMPGAFDAAVREDDVRSFFNHQESQMLGRRRPGDSKPTLTLSVDAVGLVYAATPPATIVPANLPELIERRDVDGSSMQFNVNAGTAKRGRAVWVEEIIDGISVSVREVYDLELREVGPVVLPTYTATTAERRGESRDYRALVAERDQARRQAEVPGARISEEELRARQLDVDAFLHRLND